MRGKETRYLLGNGAHLALHSLVVTIIVQFSRLRQNTRGEEKANSYYVFNYHNFLFTVMLLWNFFVRELRSRRQELRDADDATC